MINKLLALPIFIACFIPAFAQAEGDIDVGKTKAATCASCHGEDGNSMVGTFPKLAGQHSGYIIQQLKAFKSKDRNAPMMAPLAMALDDQDMQDLAAFYASQKISKNQPPMLFSDEDEDEDEKSAEDQEKSTEDNGAKLKSIIALGGDLYRNGNLKSEVSACIACHGPNGEGNKPASFPAIRGQHADYLIKSLTDFKDDARSNVSDNMMHMIAEKMTVKEIQAAAYHISMMK